MTYGKRTLIAVDQLLNTLLGGWPDETLSSRCYRWARDGVRAWPRRVVDGLFFWQREHCKSSYESEREGRQSPPELRRVTPEAKPVIIFSGRGGGDWSLPYRPGVRPPDHGPTRCCNHRARFPPAVECP